MLLGYFLQGLALGFGNGMAPGPSLALVISVSLRAGIRHGLLIAIAPLITDAAIISACLLVITNLPDGFATALSLTGACVLLWYAYETFRDVRTTSLEAIRADAAAIPPARHAVQQGALTNFLNPAPWMFWITIGGPLLTRAWHESPLAAIAFMVPFYALLVGAKAAVAVAIGAGRSRLTDRGYRWLLSAAGVMLLGLALSLANSGIAALLGR